METITQDFINEVRQLSTVTKNGVTEIIDAYLDHVELNDGAPDSSFSLSSHKFHNLQLACRSLEKLGGFKDITCTQDRSVVTLIYFNYDSPNKERLLSIKQTLDPAVSTIVQPGQPLIEEGIIAVSNDFNTIKILAEDTLSDTQSRVIRYFYEQSQKHITRIHQSEVIEAVYSGASSLRELFHSKKGNNKKPHPLFYLLLEGDDDLSDMD